MQVEGETSVHCFWGTFTLCGKQKEIPKRVSFLCHFYDYSHLISINSHGEEISKHLHRFEWLGKGSVIRIQISNCSAKVSPYLKFPYNLNSCGRWIEYSELDFFFSRNFCISVENPETFNISDFSVSSSLFCASASIHIKAAQPKLSRKPTSAAHRLRLKRNNEKMTPLITHALACGIPGC